MARNRKFQVGDVVVPHGGLYAYDVGTVVELDISKLKVRTGPCWKRGWVWRVTYVVRFADGATRRYVANHLRQLGSGR